MIWKAPYKWKMSSVWKNKNVFRRVGFNCDKNEHALSKLYLEIALQAFFKYDLENAVQIKDVFGLKKTTMCSTALVLVVTKIEHALSLLDLKNALQAFFKYDLESAYK